MSQPRATIIGAGVIGCSIARALAAGGVQVTVIDRGAPGGEASSAAAGMLSPSAEAQEGAALFPLCQASLRLYAAFAAELFDETGIDVHYRTEGTLLIPGSASERAEIAAALEWQRAAGASFQALTSLEFSQLEPALSRQDGAFFLPGDHQVDNRRLMHALVQSCRRRGVEFLLGKPVVSLQQNGRGIWGVVLENGSVAADRVINTSGAWASQIQAPAGAHFPIRPVKGHMLAFHAPGLLSHVVRGSSVYLVPRRDGRIVVGSTMEEAGFDKTPRAGPLGRLIHAAQQLCPALQDSEVVEFWTGLRPASPDGLPILGPTALEGYWVALGHFRNGILLAPVTAFIISEWLLTGRAPALAEAFRPRPFPSLAQG